MKCDTCYLKRNCDEQTEFICKHNDYCKYMPEQKTQAEPAKSCEDFYTAWNFLVRHKIFNDRFENDLWIDVVRVNPKTCQIDDNPANNTKTEVWLEHGHYDSEWGACTHDIYLDCGGDTFEEAIIKLAELVKKYYTDAGALKHVKDFK